MATRCPKCQAANSFAIEDDEVKCRMCGLRRPLVIEPPKVGNNPQPRPDLYDAEKLQQEHNGQKPLTRLERYRTSFLYRRTRKKHDQKYEKSDKAKARRKAWRDKQKLLERIERRLHERGLF